MTPTNLHLHTSIHSSSAARIHIAAYLKDISLTTTFHSLNPADDWPPESLKRLNPAAKVPVLLITNGDKEVVLTQSAAILEYFEEHFTTEEHRRLLPGPEDWAQRAKVRELVQQVCADIQPTTNQGPVMLVNTLASTLLPEGQSLPVPSPGKRFAQTILEKGLLAYEALIGECAGKFSVGDEITLADVCLVPCVQMAEAYGVVLREGGFEKVISVYENCMQKREFVEGSRREGGDKIHPILATKDHGQDH